MLLTFFLIFASFLGVKGQCTLSENPPVNGLCNADVLCYGTTENLSNLIKRWLCIITNNQFYNPMTGNYEFKIANDYNLHVSVSGVDISISEDPLIGIHDDTKVVSLIVNNGNIVSVPTIISHIHKLTELSIIFNKLESVNLRELSGVLIRTVNVSHNCISTIEIDTVDSIFPILTTTIDLSHNALETLPDNCFEIFSYLKYLDLSSNKLKELDILTFEGITQLETLKLSNNIISEVGQSFARFKNLKYLYLANNTLTSLTGLIFKTLSRLEKLNVSSNLISHIEDRTLSTQTNLEQLDLSHNKIDNICQTLFENNTKLHKLSLSHNVIKHIEGGAFSTTNISYFDIKHNFIKGRIEYDTFLGISVELLDLSGENLIELGDKAFSALSHDLRYLNLSTNLLENITGSAFQSLKILLTLDLSYNYLLDIDYSTVDLKMLTDYYLHNNKIKKVTSKMFRNMTNLAKLDLSFNKIEDIELNSFIELINLKELNISSNNLFDSSTHSMFQGLGRLITLELSNTRLISCRNGTFSGMVSLNYLNLSHSQLDSVEYETFKKSGAIELLDLSYNLLEFFHINTSSISQLLKLYLNNNRLKNITNETFKSLYHLERLSLAFNNILYIDSTSLQMMSQLNDLDLYFNYNLHIKGDVFNNLVLSQVSLKNVRQKFDFKNTLNSSVSTLILSNCVIEDISLVFVYKIRNVLKLDLSFNKIKALDKGSFQNMDSLNWLDISYNKISNIQPGTFLSNKMINSLNLFGNNLQSLQFGVFDGLKNLRVLNLSNNEIHTFGPNLLHTVPLMSKLFLDNNNIENMDFLALSTTSVEVLTVGGNSISCDALANWKKLNDFGLDVTAERLDFDSENIYGISCKGKTSFSRKITQYGNNNVNITSEDTESQASVSQFYSYLRISLNETFTKMIDLLKKNLENVDMVSANLNHSQLVFNEQLGNMTNENKNLLPQLVNTSDYLATSIKSMISLLEINNNLTELGIFHKQLLETPVSYINKYEKKYLMDIISKLHRADPLDLKQDHSSLADIKVLLYFIAVCLAIVLLLFSVVISYKYLYRQAPHRILCCKYHLYDSGQSMTINSLQME